MSLEFVTFYADGGQPPAAPIGGLSGIDQIRMLWVSIAAWDPLARLTVLTDRVTDLSGLPEAAVVRRFDLDLSRIMFERMRLQLEWLEQSEFLRPMVLIDTDILVTGDLSGAFRQDFDLAFTWRRNDDMPVNGGVIFVHNRRPEKSRQAFADVLAVYRDRYLDFDDWFGDQYAIQGFLGLTCSEIYARPAVTCGEAQILLLPCARYNHSPRPLPLNVGRPADAVLHHFKGFSRIQMRPFFEINFPAGRSGRWRGLVRVLRGNLGHFIAFLGVQGGIRRERRHFGETVRGSIAWVDRAEIALGFLTSIRSTAPETRIVDLGGDPRLQAMLARRGIGLPRPPAPEGPDAAMVAVDLEPVAASPLPERLCRNGAGPDWLILVQDLQQGETEAFTRAPEEAGYAAIASRMTLNERAVVWLFRNGRAV